MFVCIKKFSHIFLVFVFSTGCVRVNSSFGGGLGGFRLPPTYAFSLLVRCLLHAFNGEGARIQPRAGRVFEVFGGAADTPRMLRALDAGKGEVEVVNIAGIVDVSGQESSNVGGADVADFSVHAV